jgi:hypothetical protein
MTVLVRHEVVRVDLWDNAEVAPVPDFFDGAPYERLVLIGIHRSPPAVTIASSGHDRPEIPISLPSRQA